MSALAAALPVTWAYLGGRARPPTAARRAGRAALIAGFLALPLGTSGPGAVQLLLGLLAAYLAIRIVALGSGRARALPEGKGKGKGKGKAPADIARALVSVAPLLRPVPPDPARRLTRALALAVAGVAGCVALLAAGDRWRLWRVCPYADDLLVCLEVAVGTMGINNLIIAAAAARGRSVAGLQERPALATSLADFWSARWNHLVQDNLDRGFFRPLVRRGRPALGLLAAFVASGVLHVEPVLAAAPLAVAAAPAAAVMAFFLLQPALVLSERRLGWHRAPPPGPARVLARLRTVTLIVALSPLLLGPFAEICHVHGRHLGP